MKVLYLKRRGGKTTKAIAECKKTGAVLVVRDQMLRRWIMDDSGLAASQIITWQDVKNGLSCLRGTKYTTWNGQPEFILDDADRMLEDMFSFGSIRRVTISRPFTKRDCKKYGLPLYMVGRT